ncbi:hypothetical protein [Sphingomonas jatrophae]|uniref:Tetratricopeptide repeat-containing protein n=1 Tax=Sphingomonas jatrophae TaxID=1166337 RepID=A0A1I6M645_9SPHN|nr:hypothetical protein [Sphingomonas jatrophae]SFS11166.1 hypothetical protein SAMN05192580_3536 [Sphingomonas jatrophae]
MRRIAMLVPVVAIGFATPALAGPRETLTEAAFATPDKAAALQKINAAEAQARAVLARNPQDRDAQMYRAIAIGYRAKLARSRADAQTAKRMFELLAQADPRDPEPQILIGGWHLDAIEDLGGMIAGAVLGAKRATGLAAVDRAVALGRNRAMFPALAALMRVRLDAKDTATAAALAEQATRTAAPTQIDRILQQHAAAILPLLRAGNGAAAQKMARRLLPFGKLG